MVSAATYIGFLYLVTAKQRTLLIVTFCAFSEFSRHSTSPSHHSHIFHALLSCPVRCSCLQKGRFPLSVQRESHHLYFRQAHAIQHRIYSPRAHISTRAQPLHSSQYIEPIPDCTTSHQKNPQILIYPSNQQHAPSTPHPAPHILIHHLPRPHPSPPTPHLPTLKSNHLPHHLRLGMHLRPQPPTAPPQPLRLRRRHHEADVSVHTATSAGHFPYRWRCGCA